MWQRNHVESINTLRQGTLLFFKSIYKDSNLRALSSIFRTWKNMFFFSNKKYLKALYELVKRFSTTWKYTLE